MNGTPSGKPDIILIGAGIMSATLAVFLKELDPSLSIEIFEMLDGAALESSDAWNNAGTGHAALCELNYTPERADGRDARTLSEWVPIVMGGRVVNQDVAATRMIIGADVNYGALTRNLIAYLQTLSGFAIHYSHHITHLHRDADGWRVEARDLTSGRSVSTRAKFVFLGAGGGALPLLQKSGIPEAYGYAGFPVSGSWLRTDNPEISKRHHAKVYDMASVGSPPMSVPHLDTRIIGSQRHILFGPYAGFSTRFLKHGSQLDLFTCRSGPAISCP
ncbi:MAG: malate:quinone oxidoreductase [Xanthobacteraceae bacterium]